MEHSHSAFSMPERLQNNRQQSQQFGSPSNSGHAQRPPGMFGSYQNGDYAPNIGHVQPQYQMHMEPGDYGSHNLSQRPNTTDHNWVGSQHNSMHNNLPNGDLNFSHSAPQSGLLSSFGSSTSVSAATAIANIASLINSSTTSNNQPVNNNPNLQSQSPLLHSKVPNGTAGILTNSTTTSYSPIPNRTAGLSGNRHNNTKPSMNGEDILRLGDNGVQTPGSKPLRAQNLTPEQTINLQRELEQERGMRIQLQQRVVELNQRIHSQLLVEKSYEDLVQKYKTLLGQMHQMSMMIERYKSVLKQLESEKRMLFAENSSLKAQENVAHDKTMLYNILMERSKKLEEENSSLVLENETYSRQYEKCIDEISKQVVQSLLTQKALQEQCLQLQDRLGDLERDSSDGADAAVRQARQASSDSRLGWSYRSSKGRTHAASPSADSVRSMPAQHHYWRHGSATSLEHQNQDRASNNESLTSERIPEHGSPAPWTEVITEHQKPNFTQEQEDDSQHSISIETEFPANNGSPKSTRRNLERAPSSGSLDLAYHSKGFVKNNGQDVRCQRSVSAEALRDLKVTMRPKHDLTLPKSFTTPVTMKDPAAAAAISANIQTVTADVHNDLSPGSTVAPSHMTDSGVVNDPFADDADDILSKHQSLIVGSTEDLFGASHDEYSASIRRNVIHEEELSASGTNLFRRSNNTTVAPTPPPRPRSRCLSDCSLVDESKSSHLTEPSYHSSIDLSSENGPPPLPPKQYKGSRRPYKPLPAEPPEADNDGEDSSDKNTDSESIKQEINALTSQISRMASSHR